MKWKFKLWSQIKTGAKENINPKLGLRSWSELEYQEKERMWRYFQLKNHFVFDKPDEDFYYEEVPVNECDFQAIIDAVNFMNKTYKKFEYTENFLNGDMHQGSFKDFKMIFLNEKSDVVLELLSAYSRSLFLFRDKKDIRDKEDGETQEEYEKKVLEFKLEPLEIFKAIFNDIFEQFELNVRLTKGGIIPFNPKYIIKEIYDPVFEALCDKKFEKVNREIEDAIKHFRQKNKDSYSICITLCIGAIEEFLKVIIAEKYQKADSSTLADLISEALKKQIIPNDFFSKQVFSNLKSILARERKEKGNAHAKEEYATEKNAKLMLNLTVVFIQHCLEWD